LLVLSGSKERLPVMIRQLDNLLGDDSWFVANQFSWADVAVFNRLENLHGLASVYGVDVLGIHQYGGALGKGGGGARDQGVPGRAAAIHGGEWPG